MNILEGMYWVYVYAWPVFGVGVALTAVGVWGIWRHKRAGVSR